MVIFCPQLAERIVRKGQLGYFDLEGRVVSLFSGSALDAHRKFASN
jgi:hypothetical protein